MKMEWANAYDSAARLTDDGRTVVRLADLAIAVTLAHRQGMLAITHCPHLDGAALRDALAEVALCPFPDMDDSSTLWDALASHAATAAHSSTKKGAVDEWIALSQAADSGRKTRGAYATPMPLARRLAEGAIGPLVRSTHSLRIVDPSAGAGALLVGALQVLGKTASDGDLRCIVHNLYGVEIDAAARELCCLLLWVTAARAKPSFKHIAANISVDNAITRDWWGQSEYPFDVLVMNPPWESLRHTVSDTDPQASVRASTIERLQQSRPGSPGLPPLFTMQGTGDRNLFKAFLELVPHLLGEHGRFGALVPSAFASDHGMSQLRQRYLNQFALERWTSFENLRRLFPIDGRYKFGILVGERSAAGTSSLAVRSFATDPHHVNAGHAIVLRSHIERLGGPGLMLPELRSSNEVRVLSRALERGTSFFERGDFAQVTYRREVDLTLGREQGMFTRLEDNEGIEAIGDGSFRTKDGLHLVPLMEGRMVGQYDFFQKTWVGGRGRTASWSLTNGLSLDLCRPQYVALARAPLSTRVAICDVTSATNTRTVHATWVPPTWPCGNTAPVLAFEDERLAFAGLAVLNSLMFDWLARRMVSGLHLNKFYLEALVWPRLSSQALQRLANASYFLCTLNPKFAAVSGSLPPFLEDTSAFDFVSAHVLIEQEVAKGYGLTKRMQMEMLATDVGDRRGFWRHLASAPHAKTVASQVIAGSASIRPNVD